MPRRSRGPYLWLRPARTGPDGSTRYAAMWYIKDGRRALSTGCSPGDDREAQKRLAAYIAEKYRPARRERDLDEIKVADVISIFVTDQAVQQARPEKVLERAKRLTLFFGGFTLADINPALCREYEAERQGKGKSNKGTGGGARRDLEDLRAAINYHRELGLHRNFVPVSLPKRGAARQRWLTRKEFARLLGVCWSTREVQEGEMTEKRPLRHLCRFLLMAIYTGSRPGSVLSAAWDRGPGKSFVDVEHRRFHRLAEGAVATSKRQPVARLSPRLCAHLARWKRLDKEIGMVVRFNGQPVKSLKTAIKRACVLAKLEGVSAYTLRHTAATWLVAKGVPIWDVAAHLGTSPEMIDRHYGHFSPDYGERAAAAIGTK